MAPRRISLRYSIAAALLTLLAAWAVYHLKYEVRDREMELGRLRAQLAYEREAFQVARVDLDYLTRPDRIVVQAGELGMIPGRGARIVDPTRIVPAQQLQLAREPLVALLPSGAEAVLMVKPLPALAVAVAIGEDAMSLDLGLASQKVSSALAERQRRLGLVAVCFALGFLSVALRLLSMVDWHRDGDLGGGVLAAAANAAVSPDQGDEPAVRAEITDRNGVLLATNLSVPSVMVNPSIIANKDEAARRFAAVLHGVDAKQLAERLHARGHLNFAWVKRQITPEEQQAVLELGIPGIEFSYAPKRVYPKQNLASHVVGVVNVDNGGQFGIEKGMNDRLGKGAAKGPIALSLDMRVQQIVREELFSAFVRFKAEVRAGSCSTSRPARCWRWSACRTSTRTGRRPPPRTSSPSAASPAAPTSWARCSRSSARHGARFRHRLHAGGVRPPSRSTSAAFRSATTMR